MYTIIIGRDTHAYRPDSREEARSVARELSRDFPSCVVGIFLRSTGIAIFMAGRCTFGERYFHA